MWFHGTPPPAATATTRVAVFTKTRAASLHAVGYSSSTAAVVTLVIKNLTPKHSLILSTLRLWLQQLYKCRIIRGIWQLFAKRKTKIAQQKLNDRTQKIPSLPSASRLALNYHRTVTGAFGGQHARIKPFTPNLRTQQDGPLPVVRRLCLASTCSGIESYYLLQQQCHLL